MTERDEVAVTTEGALPGLSEATRNPDTVQWWLQLVCEACAGAPLYVRACERGLCMRVAGRWRVYGQRDVTRWWRDAMQQWPALREACWSVRRSQEVWGHLWAYAPELRLETRRWFELRGAVLDTVTGALVSEGEYWLTCPTLRGSSLAYQPDYEPSAAWRQWHASLDASQEAVRAWSVGAAVRGEHGLLFTFGQSRTGKSTLAEGLSEALGDGAAVFSVGRDWGRFYTQHLVNTTYLYDADAKASKQANNTNYGTLHLMASGDPIHVEVKGGELYQTTNYGFMEVVSNDPTPLTFEQSLVDRVRFCLYTYIRPRADGGRLKQLILADKQAWLNYAVSCAMRFARGEVSRPPIDRYQLLGWVRWLQKTSSYGAMCVEEGRVVSYKEYAYAYKGQPRYQATVETVEAFQEGIRELARQYGKPFLEEDWDEYEETLGREYAARSTPPTPTQQELWA